MLTREQILEVDTYCAEHNITQQQGSEEVIGNGTGRRRIGF